MRGEEEGGGGGDGYRINFHDTIIISSNSNLQRGRCIEKKSFDWRGREKKTGNEIFEIR